jgi:Mce-associated membrane protein
MRPVDSSQHTDEAEDLHRRSVRSRAVLALLVVILLASAVVIGWQLSRLVGADDAEQISPAASDRDAALAAGSLAVVKLSAADPRTPNRVVDEWLALTSGGLRERLEDQRQRLVAQLRRSAQTTTATLMTSAVTDFDVERRVASVVAVVNVRRGSDAAIERRRLIVELSETDGSWLLTSIDEIEAS